MSMISGDCFSCWSSEPWWDCYVSSLKANKMLLTTWELRELLVRNNLLILFSLFFPFAICLQALGGILPLGLFTAWNDSLIFRVFTAIPLRTAICDRQELSLIGHICHLVSFLLFQCLSCDCIYDATVHAYKFKTELLWIFPGSQLESSVSPQVSALLLVLLNTEKKGRPPPSAFDTRCSFITGFNWDTTMLLGDRIQTTVWETTYNSLPCLPLPGLAFFNWFSLLWTCNRQPSVAGLLIKW